MVEVYSASHDAEPGTVSDYYYIPAQYSYSSWASSGDTGIFDVRWNFGYNCVSYRITIPDGVAAGTIYKLILETHINGSYVRFAYITVTVVVPKFTITFRPNGSYGTVSNSGGSYNRNASVSCTATPATDYKFVGWYRGGELYSTSNPITLSASEDTEGGYTAEFTRQFFNVYFQSASTTMGTVSTPGGRYDVEGSGADCTATPNEGYVFSYWKEGTSIFSYRPDLQVQVNLLTHDCTFKAYFTKIATYTVSISAGTGGIVSPTRISDVLTGTVINDGDEVPPGQNNFRIGDTWVESSPNVGYHIGKWSGIPSSRRVTSNLSISVSFVKELKVTFNANGGVGYPPDPEYVHQSGDSLRLPNEGDLTKAGYSFAGWTMGSTTGTFYGALEWVVISSNTTFYASWTPNTYRVRFDAAGGSVMPSSMVVTYNSAYGTLPTPTYLGHSFKGWINNDVAVTSSTKYLVLGDSTLVAVWDTNTYKVSYNKNNTLASGTMYSQTIRYGESVQLSRCTFTGRTYDLYEMRFKGWGLTSADTVPIYSDQQTVTNLATAGTVALYAIWGNWATLSLECSPAAGGTARHKGTSDGCWVSDTDVGSSFIEAVANVGYRFTGWTIKSGTVEKILDMETLGYYVEYRTNATLVANFESSSHTITLQKVPSNQGTISMNAVNPVAEHTAVTFTATATSADYPFQFWEFVYLWHGITRTSRHEQATYVFSDVTADITATAYFGGTYTATFDKKGGTGGVDSVEVRQGQPMPDLMSSQLPTMPVYTFGGYFDGWEWEYPSGGHVTGTKYYNADGSSAHIWDKSQNATLYAYWTSYMNITLNVSPAGAGNATGGGQKETGAAFTITATANAGYVFDKWTWGAAASSSDNPRTFSAGQVVADMTYTANFIGVQYRVRFNPNGGVGAAAYQTFRYGTAQNLTTVAALGFTNGDYTFDRWNTKADGSGDWYSDGASVSNLSSTQDDVINLYAIWVGASYLLTFSADPAAYGTVTETVGETTTSNPQFLVQSGASIVINDTTLTVDGHTILATPSAGCSFANWSGYSTPVGAPQTIKANFTGTPENIVVRLVKGRQYLSQTVLDNEGNVLEAQLDTSPNIWNGMTFTNQQ